MNTRSKVLLALAVGCAMGVGLSCIAEPLEIVAHADYPIPPAGAIVSTPCGRDGYAVFDFPGSSAYDLAANVYSIAAVLPAHTLIRATRYAPSDAVLGPVDVTDGFVATGCTPGGTARLYVRTQL